MIIDFVKAVKDKDGGKKNADIYTAGYHSLFGALSGILLFKLLDTLDLPGKDKKIDHALISGKEIENSAGLSVAKTIVMMISSGVMSLELIGVKGAMVAGGSLMLGYTWASSGKEGKYIGQV